MLRDGQKGKKKNLVQDAAFPEGHGWPGELLFLCGKQRVRLDKAGGLEVREGCTGTGASQENSLTIKGLREP